MLLLLMLLHHRILHALVLSDHHLVLNFLYFLLVSQLFPHQLQLVALHEVV